MKSSKTCIITAAYRLDGAICFWEWPMRPGPSCTREIWNRTFFRSIRLRRLFVWKENLLKTDWGFRKRWRLDNLFFFLLWKRPVSNSSDVEWKGARRTWTLNFKLYLYTVKFIRYSKFQRMLKDQFSLDWHEYKGEREEKTKRSSLSLYIVAYKFQQKLLWVQRKVVVFVLTYFKQTECSFGCWLGFSHFQVCFWQGSQRWWWKAYS